MPVAVAEAMLAPQTKWPRWLVRKVGRECCSWLHSFEEKERQGALEAAHEYGSSDDELDPLLDWSQKGSPRELFMLDVIQHLRLELRLKEAAELRRDELDKELQEQRQEQRQEQLEEDRVQAEVLQVEQLEIELECARARQPIWVCVCHRAMEDECDVCPYGAHTKEA